MDNQIINNDLSQCKQCVCFNLRKSSRAVTQFYDEALHASGLRGTQFTLLAFLYNAGVTSISLLSNALVMDRTTLSRNLKPLEKKKFITIKAGKDRRMKTIHLTKSGRNKLLKTFPLWQKAQSYIIQEIGQERWENILDDISDVVSTTHSA